MSKPGDLPPQPDFFSGPERIHDEFQYHAPADPASGAPQSQTVTGASPATDKEKVSPTRKLAAAQAAAKKPPQDEFDFFKYLSVIFRRKRLVFVSVIGVVLLSFIKNIGTVEVYQAETKLNVQLKQQNPVGQFDPGYFWDRQTKINTLLNIIKSREVMQRVQDALHLNISVVALSGSITAKRIEQTNILSVISKSPDPELAARIANTLADVFITFNSEINRKDISDAISYIERQIEKTGKELKEKEELLKNFQQTHRIVESTEESSPEMQKLTELETALQATVIQIVENKERMVEIQKLLQREKVYVEESYTFDNTLESKLVQLNMEMANALAEYGPEHRRVKFIKENIKQLTDMAKKSKEGAMKTSSTKSLNQNRIQLFTEYNDRMVEDKALTAKKTAYENVLKDITRQVFKVPEVQLEYRRIKREKENIEAVYQLLQTKYQEQRIRYELQSADIVLLETAAVPRTPIQQGARFGLLLMLFIGLAVGIGLAYLVEFFDQTIKSPQAVEEELGLPILGIIPLMEEDSKVIDLESKSSILEPYRSLRTNIRYTNVGAEKRTILVTSAIQGDGKTTKVCNLAISFALEGKRVMVIDADLRRAALHKVMNVNKEIGLSEYLSGQATFEEIQKKVFDGLITIVTSGNRPPNPAELLGSRRFFQLLQEASATHDMIFIDSPALVPVSDALLLAPFADSTILIGRALRTPLKAMLFAKNSLIRSGANIIGLVFNGVHQPKGYYPYYSNYYNYYSYYRSHYYYYEDDKETEHLPKNFREFLFFAARQLLIDGKAGVKRIWRKHLNLHALRILFAEHRKLMVFFLLTLSVLFAFSVYTVVAGKKGLLDDSLPEDFRYQPLGHRPASPVVNPEAVAGKRPFETAEPTAAPESGAIAEPSARRSVMEQMNLWQSARQVVNREAYASFYSREFFPDLQAWLNRQEALFLAMKQMTLMVDSLQFMEINDSAVVMTCRERLQNDYTQSVTVQRKTLEWRKVAGGWKIVREETGR
ncbi:MAG: polysaccharide biosynthesis tyrosine autokinase [Fibrobacterota bacterium]